MEDAPTITVNFGKPMGLFCLDSAVLLPQQVIPMHVFEERYTQMVSRVLDGSGQFALASFAGEGWKDEYEGEPALREAVCIGQIVQHEPLPGDRYNLLVHGVCRAKIAGEEGPDGDRLYRRAMLEPIGAEQEPGGEWTGLEELRAWVGREIDSGRLGKLSIADQLLEYVNNEAVPDRAILDVLAFALVQEPALRYRLLAEGSLSARAEIVSDQVRGLDRLIRLALAQHPEEWPKGLSWN